MQDKNRIKKEKRQRKKLHIRKKIYGTPEKPRLVVFRSLKNIYAQLVDDTTRHTLAAASSLSKDLKEDLEKAEGKVGTAYLVGKEIARKAKIGNITTAVFDRGGYLYHGRVKALADGAREGGLKF